MKIKAFQLLGIAAVTTFLFLGNVQAVTITLNGGTGYDLNSSAYSVGTIINGIQAGGQANRDVLMTNNLLTVAPGAYGVIGGEEYHRSSNFGALPAAVAAGAVVASGGGLNFGTNGFGAIASLTLAATYQYLVVAYDGPNGGVIVYNISSLSVGTVIEMARNAEPMGDAGAQALIESTRYQMTGWTLLNPTQNTVPDGGATVMLLGASLGALAIGRRFLLKRSL